MDTSQNKDRFVLALFLILAWLGLLVHNIIESVDGSTIAIGLISAALFLAWWRIPLRRDLTVRLPLILGLVQLIGAIVTVLPLGILPFSPEQNLTHYLVHVVYGASQLPLITATARMKARW